MLFRYLQEKDVFEKYYKQHLAKRLLSGRAVSPSHEPSSCSLLLRAAVGECSQPCRSGILLPCVYHVQRAALSEQVSLHLLS